MLWQLLIFAYSPPSHVLLLIFPCELTRIPHVLCDTKKEVLATVVKGQEDSLEKEMATQSSILIWRIPWTEETGRLQFMGLQSWTRLRTHDIE